jgi:uncharacterized protein (TIGR02217 family)
MSNAVFPALPGLTFNITKSPTWSTKVQRSAGGKELRAAFYSSPIWRWVLQYEMLRSNAAAGFTELQTLAGFFNARQGMFDSFLFADPDDSAVTAESFGTGDGATTTFQLKRAYGGFVENVYDLNGAPSIYKTAVLQSSGYSVSASGLVTFTTAPANAVALTWTGSFYWRVRFDQDAADFNKFMNQLWDLKQLAFVSVK